MKWFRDLLLARASVCRRTAELSMAAYITALYQRTPPDEDSATHFAKATSDFARKSWFWFAWHKFGFREAWKMRGVFVEYQRRVNPFRVEFPDLSVHEIEDVDITERY